MPANEVTLVNPRWSGREVKESGVTVPGAYWLEILKAVELNGGGGDDDSGHYTAGAARLFAEALRAAVGADPRPVASPVASFVDQFRVRHNTPAHILETGTTRMGNHPVPGLRPEANRALLESVLALFEAGHAVKVVRRPF